MSFLNVVLTMDLAVANTTLSTTPINDAPAPLTLAATTVYYNPAFQAGTSPTTVPLPPTATGGVCVAYVKNLDPTNNLTVTYTWGAGSPTSIVLIPSGVFMIFQPTETGQGISALSLTATAATINAEVFLGY